MKTILDTSALIALIRGEGETGRAAKELVESGDAVIPAICAYELLAGVKKPDHIHQRQRLLSLCPVLAMDRNIAEYAAELFTMLRTRGITVNNEDLIIASTAIHNRLPILTLDKGHFSRMPGLFLV